MDEEVHPEIETIWDEARVLIEQGNLEKAIEIYKYVLVRYEDEPVAVEYANAYLGDLYLTLRRLNLAEKHIKKAIQLSPDKGEYHYLLGFAYSTESQWEKAISELKTACSLQINNAEYARALGWALFNTGQTDDGLRYLRLAVRLDPDAVEALMDMANAYLMLLSFSTAKRYAKRALDLEPKNERARLVAQKIKEIHRMFRSTENNPPAK